MGLHDTITQKIAAAFDGPLADAVKSLNVVVVGDPVYDPDTGVPVPNETIHATRGVPQPVDKSHVDGEVVKIEDIEFIILQDELAVEPDVIHFVEYAGDRYSVNIRIYDPADVTWTLTGRKVLS